MILLIIFPDWGNFTGPTITESDDSWYFNPALAGAGAHDIVFEAAGCTGHIFHYRRTVCHDTGIQLLRTQSCTGTQRKSHWWCMVRSGISRYSNRLVRSAVTGTGEVIRSHIQTANGCITWDTIDIILWDQVDISGVDQLYCFSDTVINITLDPPDGTLYLNGVESVPTIQSCRSGHRNS